VVEQGQVLGSIRQAGVLADGTVTEHRSLSPPQHRCVVAIAVSALRSLERLLAAAAVETVALEVSDRFDDRREVAPGHRGVAACPTDRLLRRADGHLQTRRRNVKQRNDKYN